MCTFLCQNYRSYFEAGGVQELTEEERMNPDLFYHNNTLDLKYEGINVKVILAFLATKKTKPSGKTSSFSHIRKSHDAILLMRFRWLSELLRRRLRCHLGCKP
jgi:hypothetical protein